MKRLMAMAAVILAAGPALAQTEPAVFEVSNPICRTVDIARAGVLVQVFMRAKLIDPEPIGHVTVVMHMWHTDRNDRRQYLNSVRNEVFVKDPNQNGTVPEHANNPDLDIRPGEIVGFTQDKYYPWTDVESVRCGRMAFYHQGKRLPIVINKNWRYSGDQGWVGEP